MNDYKIQILQNLKQIKSSQKELDHFISTSNNISIFNTTEFILNWCKIYLEPDDQLFCILIHRAGKLVAYAPLYITNRQLNFICSGKNEVDEISAEYQDIIVESGYEKDILRCLQTIFIDNSSQWDSINFTNYLRSSFISKNLLPLFKQLNWVHHQQTLGYKYYINLSAKDDDFDTKFKGSFYRGLKSKHKKLSQLGVKFEIISTLSQSVNSFESLCEMHNHRWNEVNKTGAFESNKFYQFHRNLLTSLFSKRSLFLFRAFKDNIDISVIYGYIYNNNIHFYQSGYEYKNYGKYSLGAISHYVAMQELSKLQYNTYDFMRGDFDSYKKRFKCLQEEMFKVTIHSPGFKNTLQKTRTLLKNNINRNLLDFSLKS